MKIGDLPKPVFDSQTDYGNPEGDNLVVIDDYKVDPSTIPSAEVSDTAPGFPPSPSKKKLIITEVFSAEGTAKNRQDGTYGFPGNLGDGSPSADQLRDAMGKYWTYSDNGKDIIFLNPSVNKDPVNTGNANLPLTIHFSKPTLKDDGIWPEYIQDVVLTPDLNWVYENIAIPYFDKAATEVEGAIKVLLEEGASSEKIKEYLEDFFYKPPNDSGFGAGSVPNFKQAVEQWWFHVMQVELADKGCEPLAQALFDNSLFAGEACAPWLQLNVPYLDHVLDVGIPIENNLSEQYQPLVGVKFPFYNLKSEYNFYIQNYENILKQFKNKAVPNSLTEKILPNIYPFISSFVPQKLTGEKSDYNKYKNLISLAGIVKDYTAEALKITGDILEDNNLKKPPKSSKRYFSKWTSDLGKALLRNTNNTLATLQGVGDKYKMVLFPMYHPTILQDYDDQKFMFPMYNELDFSTGKDNVVGDITRQTRLSNDFMRFFVRFAEPEKLNFDALLEASFLTTLAGPKTFVEVEDKFSIALDPNGQPTTTTEKIIDESKVFQLTELEAFLATLNLDELFLGEGSQISNLNITAGQYEQAKNYSMDSEINVLLRENTTFITVDENDDYAGMNAGKEMQKMLLAVVFAGKLRKMAKQKFRSFEDIMAGKTNYSETVMYVVNKRIVSARTGEAGDVMQSYYFLNTSKVDVLRFIDSQVNYNVQYQYDVEAIVLSLGTSYYYYNPEKASGEGQIHVPGQQGAPSYEDFVEDDSDEIKIEDIFDPEEGFDSIFANYFKTFDGKSIIANGLSVALKVRSKPNYKLVRVQIASTRGRVVDKPPVFPDALITPYKGVNNKLLINLNQNVGEYFMKPIFFNQNDQDQYLDQLDAQKVTGAGKTTELLPIEYKGDDQIGKDGYFEVYRLDRRPQTYKDFQGHLMTEIRGYHEMEVGHMDTNSVSLQDDILPNRKYYYTFRVVDVHGHVSNPSPVFEVEMVDDNGTVYMLQKIIELQPPNIKDVSKTAKKYIQIKPAFEHTLMSVDAAGDVDASAFDYGDGGSKGPINLGVMPVALWGKKFKIRITSKSSGKQIDLNVNFNKKERTNLGNFADNKIYTNDS